MTGKHWAAWDRRQSITGQCNAMGSRLFSNTTNLPAVMIFKTPDIAKRSVAFWYLPKRASPPGFLGLRRDPAGLTAEKSRPMDRGNQHFTFLDSSEWIPSPRGQVGVSRRAGYVRQYRKLLNAPILILPQPLGERRARSSFLHLRAGRFGLG